jgi:hypothetical protein
MLLFARMDRLSHRLGRRSHNSAVAQYQKVIDKHFSKTGDLAWTGTAGGEGEQIATGRSREGNLAEGERHIARQSEKSDATILVAAVRARNTNTAAVKPLCKRQSAGINGLQQRFAAHDDFFRYGFR